MWNASNEFCSDSSEEWYHFKFDLTKPYQINKILGISTTYNYEHFRHMYDKEIDIEYIGTK